MGHLVPERGLSLTGGTVGTATHRGAEAFEDSRRGAMVEPPLGAPAMQPLLDDLAALNRDLRLIIEQDMYPAPVGSAKAIAARTRNYFTTLGLPPAED